MRRSGTAVTKAPDNGSFPNISSRCAVERVGVLVADVVVQPVAVAAVAVEPVGVVAVQWVNIGAVFVAVRASSGVYRPV
jgi:hypothetical protein